MADEVAAVPEKEGVAAEDGEVGGAETDALGQPTLVAVPLGNLERRRVGRKGPRLADERLHCPNLSQRLPVSPISKQSCENRTWESRGSREFAHLLGYIARVGQGSLAFRGQLRHCCGVDDADDGYERSDGEGDEGQLPRRREPDHEPRHECRQVVYEVAQLQSDAGTEVNRGRKATESTTTAGMRA